SFSSTPARELSPSPYVTLDQSAGAFCYFLRQAMAALRRPGGFWFPRSIARGARATDVGRPVPHPRQSIHKKSGPCSRSIPSLSLSRLIFGSLPTSPESLLHGRLLSLEHRCGRVSSEQHFP